MSSFRIIEWLENTEFSSWAKVACGTVICGTMALYFIGKLRTTTKRTDYPRDTVILHQIYRATYSPSMSPFAVKLETYLRMANIPYQNVHSFETSPKGKFPWIEYNGEIIGDSQFCIEFLNKTKGIDFNANLSNEEKAIARAFQKMLEENTYWTLMVLRWHMKDDKLQEIKNIFNFSRWNLWHFKRLLMNEAYAQGIGRHDEDEICNILTEDLNALSVYLGNKKFLFGDKACETDCAVFGMLTAPYYQSFGNRSGDAIKKFPNLCEYCERMKSTYWPDWDKCITHGGTRRATK